VCSSDLVTVLVLYFESKARGQKFATGKIASRLGLVELGAWKTPMFLLLVGLATVSLLVPLGSLLRWSIEGFGSVDWVTVLGALANSVGLAVSGGLLTTFAALAIAVLTIRHRQKLTSVLERSVWLTHATPGIVVALSLVFFSNQVVPWVYQTTFLVLIAYLALFLPNALAAVSTPIRQSPKALDEVSSSLGLTTMQTLRKVVLPIAGPGIFAATTLVILTVLKELPATLLLRPTGMETLATRLWTETSVAAFSAAAPYALLLVVLAGFPAWLLNRAIRKDLEPMEMERYQ
jgi:iron(III) transport system permease protein